MESLPPGIDLPSKNFQPELVGLGAWTDHLHFGYDAIAALRPRVLVELGTDRGESYFGFCQSVVDNHTATQCYAVDSWQGDLHVGGYDETTFRQVAEYNRAHYERFSTLLRCRFDEALGRFDDDSTDLLHLDGLHTESAVRQDLDRWLPKLRCGGILMMHDVTVRSRGFGVWKAWEELRKRGRSFTFEVGPGLGLWEKPPREDQPALIESLFAGPSPQTERLLAHYRVKAAEVHQRIAQSWRDATISGSYFAQQTTVQVFFSSTGSHREDDSVLARIGHGEWKHLRMPLPAEGARSIRIDFVSAFTTIAISTMRVRATDGSLLFDAGKREAFDAVRVTGDAERLPDSNHLRIKITGIDPQLYLPELPNQPATGSVTVELELRVEDAGHSPI